MNNDGRDKVTSTIYTPVQQMASPQMQDNVNQQCDLKRWDL